MKHIGATCIKSRFERGEPEHGGVDIMGIWAQHVHSGGDSTHCQPDFTPDRVHTEPVLKRGPSSIHRWSVEGTMVDDYDCVNENAAVTVAERTSGNLQPSPLLPRLYRQAMDVPYTTMVSFTKEAKDSGKRHLLTYTGEESAHLRLAVLLLRKSFDSV
jgi:hypothetical protein